MQRESLESRGFAKRESRMSVLAVWLVAFAAAAAHAGTLEIPAWSFARGNGRIHVDPQGYADAGPIVGTGAERPWGSVLEYDIHIPVTAKYTFQVCYASAEARPTNVSFDKRDPDRCCMGITLDTMTAGQTAQPTFHASGAKWEALYNYSYRGRRHTLSEIALEEGLHTVKLSRLGPLPHVVAMRLHTTADFPADWKPPRYKVRDIGSIPKKFRGLFQSSGSARITNRPALEFPKEQAAGSLEIPAWTFDRGNARIYANPEVFAEVGPLAGGGSPAPAESTVEYDIDFPVTGEYNIQVRYASPEPRPTDFWFDGRPVGKGCLRVTIGSSRFELPVKLSGTSRSTKWTALYDYRQGRLLKIKAARGKHTLKLSRRGPLPNLQTLLLNTQTAFPKDWQQPPRRTDLSRVAPRFRRVFMQPGDVNVATLRQAVQDAMKHAGAGYPRGKGFLERLAKLESRQKAAEDGSAEQMQALHDEADALQSEILSTHPAMRFDRLIFLKRSSKGYGHTYADQHSHPMGGNLCVLSPVKPGGMVTTLVPELDGGLFDRFDLSFDARRVVFGYRPDGEGKSFRIYEIAINPDTGVMVPGSLRQLSRGGGDEDAEAVCRNQGRVSQIGHDYDDMDPCYLPDGRIMFASTRAMQLVFCSPGSSVTNLYVMDADGGNVRRISDSPVNETALSLMDDGRVIYTRWEYINRGIGNGESLWAVRPDGTGVDHVYKNNTTWPAAMSSARSIPGTSSIVTVAGGHHFAAVGPVVLVDNDFSRRANSAMTTITPELGYPPSMGYPRSKFGTFMDPYPLSEKFFIVSHRLSVERYKDARYGLYLLDAWGNRAKLYGDPDISCYEPMPLRPRLKPAMVAEAAALKPQKEKTAKINKAPKQAALFIQDIYQGMTGIARGRVKYVRVMGALTWPWHQNGISWALGLNTSPHRKRIYGIAKVHEDGSCYFTAPVGENIFFHALDENYMALQQMPTFINLMAGETRSCVGCHESRKRTPHLTSVQPVALKHPPQVLMPQPGDTGVRMVHYPVDVQTVFDQKCVGCHSGESPRGRLDLVGEPTAKYSRSYENLILKGLVSYDDGRYGSANFNVVPPLSRGAYLSKLYHQILKAPCKKANVTRIERIRIATWIDSNVPYYGTYRGKRNLEDKDDPEFRLPPLVAK